MLDLAPRFALALLVSCFVSAALGAGERDGRSLAEIEKAFGPPVLFVPRPGTAVAIDGRLDEEAWSKARPVALGFLVGGWDAPSQKTEARVLADEKAVYFGVRCFEAQPDRMIAAGKARDGDLWNGDTVEFFLDPGHGEKRGEYYHVIVNPKGLIYDGRGKNAKAWDADVEAKAGTFEGGWTVEVAVPMKDLGVPAGGIPKVWGLNVNRQRPELGEVDPVGHPVAPATRKLKDPAAYRMGEDSAWSPTYCESSHVIQRFGHAVLEAGARDVAPPGKLFEVLYRTDFEDGSLVGWTGAKIVEESFRGPGKCLAPKDGEEAAHLTRPLEDLDDVTLIYALKMPEDGRFSYYGRAPDDEQCEADRHDVLLTKETADARKWVEMDEFCTHASRMAWKPNGKRGTGPGPWAMMSGHFAEPSIGNVMSPGKDWVVVRTRLGMMRRQGNQAFVPAEQNYPRGLTFAAGKPWLLDNIVIFRGADVEPPDPAPDVAVRREGDDLAVSWSPARDNTLTAYYRVCVGGETAAETHRLAVRLKAAGAEGRPVAVVAYDLYGNASKPSEAKVVR